MFLIRKASKFNFLSASVVMLTTVKTIIGFRFWIDGEIVGNCSDLLFDDRLWRVRYLVFDSPDTPAAHQRLAPVRFVDAIDHDDRAIHLESSFTNSHIELLDRPPVSLQSSINIFRSFGMTWDWIDGALATRMPKPCLIAGNDAKAAEKLSQSHLRAVREVCTYAFEVPGISHAHVTDLTVDDSSWSISDILVQERPFLLFEADVVRVPPDTIESIEWARSRVLAKQAPPEMAGM